MPLGTWIAAHFLNPFGLYALLSLIPLILLYLIRPKPKRQTIPSLMFFFRNREKSRLNSFLRYISRNLLFLMHFLAITLLAIAIATPYILERQKITTESTAIVLDVSASMQAKEGLSTRFEQAKDAAKDALGKRNTLVIAGATAELLAKDQSSSEVENIIDSLKPKDTPTALGEAILLAGDSIDRGKVVVISDFIATGSDPLIAKKLIEAKGIIVEFIDVASPAENIGIIDLIVNEENSVAYIKNYNNEPASATVSILDISKRLELAPGSIETFHFTTPPGTTELRLNADDDFSVDNIAYISAPEKKKIKALLITNNKESNLYYALISSPRISLEVVEPPIVPHIAHDLVIVSNVQARLLLKETINEISDAVAAGSGAIIVAQDDLSAIEWEELLPVALSGSKGGETKITKQIVNKYTEDIIFGSTRAYLQTSSASGSVIASAQDNSSLIVSKEMGKGKVLYYGIFDSESSFRTTPWYPIFWDNMARFLVGREDISQLNKPTGSFIGTERHDDAGMVNLQTRTVAFNLLNEKESNVNQDITVQETLKQVARENSALQRPRPIDLAFVLFTFLLIALELLFIKFRGDL
ncbi:BatA domain-containing protein [Candidatus Woesearchaeota archaeon]|nr:BatA domain-containing protein [Candidatus Woesearchaeota archaeon]